MMYTSLSLPCIMHCIISIFYIIYFVVKLYIYIHIYICLNFQRQINNKSICVNRFGTMIDLWANVKYYEKPIYCDTEKIEGVIFKGRAMLGETTYSVDIVNDFLASYSLEIKEKMTNDQINDLQ